MKNLTTLTQNLDQLDNLKGLVTVLQELSAQEVTATKDKVVASRNYHQGLGQIYTLVKSKNKTSQKSAAILLSSNQKLQGSVSVQVFNAFADYMDKNPDHKPIIIGQIGKSLFERRFPHIEPTVIPMLENPPYIADQDSFISAIETFNQIRIFHGLFVNIAFQKQTETNLDSAAAGDEDPEKHYLFEPERTDLEQLFRTQFASSLVTHSFMEADLAHQAARVLQLDSAIGKIDNQSKSLFNQKRNFIKKLKSKRQQTRLARMI